MATSTDEVIVRFKTEGGDTVEEVFRRTGESADRFHQKITKASGALGDIRLKSEGRIASNLGAITQSFVGGANAGELFATAITKATESFRGSLLFAGAATVGFALYQGITKAGEAAIKLETDIANLRRSSLSTGNFLGTDQINQGLDQTIGKLDEILSRVRIERGTGIAGRFQQALRGVPLFLGGQGGRTEQERKDDEQINELRATGLRLLEQTADKTLEINDIIRTGISGNEKDAELAKIKADHLERAFKIASLEAKLGVQGVSSAQAAETAQFDLQNVAVEKKYRLQERSLELQRKLVDVERELLLPEQESLRKLDTRISYLKSILAHELFLTNQERAQYQLQQQSAEAERTRAQYNLFRQYDPLGYAKRRIEEEQSKEAYKEAKERYDSEERERRAGKRDVRDRFLKEYEDLLYGKNPDSSRDMSWMDYLSNKDFSGIASLSGLDYTGIKSLANFPVIKVY